MYSIQFLYIQKNRDNSDSTFVFDLLLFTIFNHFYILIPQKFMLNEIIYTLVYFIIFQNIYIDPF